MTRVMIRTAVLVFILSPVAGAQSVPPTVEQNKAAIEQRLRAGGGGRLVAAVETRVTTGRPYSAEAVTESLQVLGDGNRISRRNVTRVYRDNDGRTRRVQSGPAGEMITIWDPVSSTSFTLDPATKTAYQSPLLGFAYASPSGATGGRGGGFARSPNPALAADEQSKVEEARRRGTERAPHVEMAETSREAAGQMKKVLELAASGGGNITREDLGQQNIEGVLATGTRSTTIIPAGAIGNLQEIRVVSEQWFSPELEVLVLTRHSDPRVGETIYRLTNIVRGYPDPSLFMVPADYTIKQRGVKTPE